MIYKYLYDAASRYDYLAEQMSQLGKEGFRFVALIPHQETVHWQDMPLAYVHIIMAKEETPEADPWVKIEADTIKGIYEARIGQGDTPEQAIEHLKKALGVEP